MTLVQLVNPVRQSVGANRANIPTAVSKHLTPLERELEAVEGISLHQFNQPVAEVVGRVSVVTPTTASRARFHPQLWQCFVDQSWPDKELVVVETYYDLLWWTFGLFSAHCTGGLAIEVHCDQTSSEWGPHCGGKKKSHHFVGQWSVLRQFWWWWFICQQVCGVHGDSDAAEKLGRPDVVRLAQFLRGSRLCGIFGPKSWDPEDEDEMDEILYGYGFSYAHLRVMAMFYPYPNLAFAEDAPFMLKLREKMGEGRVGLLEDLDGLCLHIVHSTSSTPDPEISHKLTEEELDGLVVSECRAYDCFMDNYSTSFSWFTGIFTSLLFQFWSCWSDLRTCRSDQLIWLDFTNVRFHHGFCFNFTIFAKCSRKVGKETTAFESQKENSWERKVSCYVWTPLAIAGWRVRRYALNMVSWFAFFHQVLVFWESRESTFWVKLHCFLGRLSS